MSTSEIAKLESRWRENRQGLTFAPLAEAYRKMKEPQRALEILGEGLALHPDYIPASIVLGRCHLDLGDDAAAEAAFGRVLALDGENVIALKALADITERHLRFDESENWLRQLLVIDRSNDEARAQLTRVEDSRRNTIGVVRDETGAAADTSAEDDTGEMLAASSAERPAEAPEPDSAPVEPDDAGHDFEPVDAVPEAPAEQDHAPHAAWLAFDTADAAQGVGSTEPQELLPSDVAAPELAAPASPDFESPLDMSDSLIPVQHADELELRSSGASEFQSPDASADLALSPVLADAERSDAFGAIDLPPDALEDDDFAADDGLADELVANELVATDGPSTAGFGGDDGLGDDLTDDGLSDDLDDDEIPADAILEPLDTADEPVPHEWTPMSADQEVEADSWAGQATGWPDAPDASTPSEEPSAETPPAQAESADDSPVVPDAEPDLVVTESMAELYLRQGHAHDALTIYRELYLRRPDDARLRNRVTELETAQAAADPGEPEVPVYSAGAGGRSVAALFQDLLAARPAPASWAPLGSAPASATGPAAAPGGATADGSEGEPTRPADDRLSLSAVFGDDSSPVPPAISTAQAGDGMSFDAFFDATPTAEPAPRRAAARDDDDLDQFHAWLQNLKR